MKDLYISNGNVKIHIHDYEQSGAAVIFLHFGGANLMMWQRALPFFKDKYRLILVDMRGHGKSDKPESGYHIDEMAADVAAVMDYLKVEQAHIIGCSMGAEVGLSLAANYPDRALSLVCEGALYSEYGPYGVWKGSYDEFEAYATEQLEKIMITTDKHYPSEQALVEANKKAIEKFVPWNAFFEQMKRYEIYQNEKGQFVSGMSKACKLEYMKHYYDYRFEDYYRRVKCPLLILPDEEDSQVERIKVTMNGFKQLAAQAEIVLVPNWSHPYGWLLDPQAICKKILDFLAMVD